MNLCKGGCVQTGGGWLEILAQAKTNVENIGYSIIHLEVKKMRKLTDGEVDYCRKVFKDSIDYDSVRIICGVHETMKDRKPPGVISDQDNPFIFFPPRDSQPKGSVHFYQEDYSKPELNPSLAKNAKLLFIHEMTHIWQRSRRKYKLTNPSPDMPGMSIYFLPWEKQNPKNFENYNHEQQAEIVAIYFDFTFLGISSYPEKKKNYVEFAIKKLLANPFDRDLIPANARSI